MEFEGKWVSAGAFDVLWGEAVPNEPRPAILGGESPGATAAERRRVVVAAMEELQRGGYLAGGSASPAAGDAIRTVCLPRLAVDLRVFKRTQTGQLMKRGVRVAVNGHHGAIAESQQEGFRAVSFPAPSLASEVVRQFDRYHVPRFAGATVTPQQLVGGRRGLSEHVARQLAGSFLCRAHLSVIRFDTARGRGRVLGWLMVNDAADGRYLAFADRNQIAIIPGKDETLERKIKEMIEPTGMW